MAQVVAEGILSIAPIDKSELPDGVGLDIAVHPQPNVYYLFR